MEINYKKLLNSEEFDAMISILNEYVLSTNLYLEDEDNMRLETEAKFLTEFIGKQDIDSLPDDITLNIVVAETIEEANEITHEKRLNPDYEDDNNSLQKKMTKDELIALLDMSNELLDLHEKLRNKVPVINNLLSKLNAVNDVYKISNK